MFVVSVFVMPFGIAFGLAATEAGMSPLQAIAMSASVFSATAQFATLDLLQDPVAYLSLILAVLALNARHIIMGAALSPWINQLKTGRRLTVLAFLSDANFADMQATIRKGETDLGILFGGGLMMWTSWVAGSALGATGGNFLGNPDSFGFDVVMACFFAAIVVGQLRQTPKIGTAGVAIVTSIITLPILPTGWNIICAACAGGLVSVLVHDE